MSNIELNHITAWFITNDLPPRFSGAGRNDLLLAEHIGEYGVDVCFVVRRHKGDDRRDSIKGIPVYRIGSTRSRFAKIHWLFDYVNLLLRSESPDIIRFRGFSYIYAAAIFLSKIFKPSIRIVSQPACYGVDDAQTTSKKMLGGFQLKQLLKSDAIFAMNNLIRNELIEYGYPFHQIFPVRNPVNTDLFFPLNSRQKKELRKEMKMPEGIILVTVGIFEARKHQAFITKAFAQCFSGMKRHDIWLLHIGPRAEDMIELGRPEKVSFAAKEEKELFAVAEEYKCKEHVILTGNQQNTARYLQLADVFIHASIHEGEANVVNEALSSGLTLIIPDNDVFSSQVPDDCAIRFMENDLHSLVASIREVVQDKIKRTTLQEKGRAHIMSSRTIEEASRHYANMIKRIK